MKILIVLLIIIILLLTSYLFVLHRLWSKLNRRQRMRQYFIYNVSKQIRQPLAHLAKIGDIVADEHLYISKTEKRDIAEQTRRYVDMVGCLLDEVAIFMDPHQQSYVLSTQKFSPNLLCRRCMALMDQKEGLQLQFNKELSDEVFVTTDPHLLEMILVKLLQLSMRFTQQGQVTVGCSLTANHSRLVLTVQDTGVGIPQERRSKLFNWFDEPDGMYDEAELDLSIAQRLVNRIGGQLIHDGTCLQGTKMVVMIPVK